MPQVKITKRMIDAIAFTGEGQAFFWDTELQGFGLRVTKGAKTYVAQKRINGKTARVTVGRHGPMTPEQARKAAQELLGGMTMGKNPADERREAKARGVTLGEVFDAFLSARKALKPRTVKDYREHIDHYFKDWGNRPIREITKGMVERRHKDIGQKRGHAQANLAMRYLRSILNFAMGKYEDAKGRSLLAENPVRRLSQTRAWYRVERRRTYIKDHDLGAFLDALDALRAEIAGSYKTTDAAPDYFEVILFTGLRRQEAATLKWADVDMKAKTLTIQDTKNREPLTLPMPDRVYDILSGRHQTKGEREYVFPGESAAGHLVEPKRQMKKVTTLSGVTFALHDLRR
ncbi:MAG: integrase family protein, partial [Nitrospinae bacterium]|nr:integrase family protein [Nitrospinota bacterium]